MKAIPHWCFVEVKGLAETPADLVMLHELQSGKPSLRWIDLGVRLRQSIKDSAAQLWKFSHRGFPTVVCFFDITVGFYLEGGPRRPSDARPGDVALQGFQRPGA
jgi:hypothetical protein